MLKLLFKILILGDAKKQESYLSIQIAHSVVK